MFIDSFRKGKMHVIYLTLFQVRILFPLRNPKSIAVSYFYHRKNLLQYEYDGSFNGFLPDFIDGMGKTYNHM